MAKKTLLSEGQVRKFMELGAIGPLTENFLAEADEDGEMGDEMGPEMGGGEEGAGEEGAEEAEMPAAEAETALMGLAGKLKELADALGVEMTVGGEMETEDSESLEEGEDPYGEEGGDYLDEDLYEELNESVKVIDPQRITKEVSRRVAQRLIKESKQEKLAEALAAKIAARLR